MWTFSLVVVSEGSSLVVVHSLLTAVAGASLVVENGLSGTWAQ